MDERMRLVSLRRTGQYTVTELAEAFGVSRKTAHKWLARYAAEGAAGLQERARRPHHVPTATPLAVVQAVLRAKAVHPTWGPAKLHPERREPPEIVQAWPSVSTRGDILARHALTAPRRRRRRVAPWTRPFQGCTGPNAVWCVDFKGWFRTRDGQRCDPLTISDAFSRLLLCCEIVARPDHAHVRPVLERVFREYGLPEAIRTDNGPPFASLGAGGLSPLSVWWIKLGIMPERIAPGHPEQNGRHERLHGTLKQETLRPPAPTPADQQARWDTFRHEYNTQRPHEALGQVPPATVYTPSPHPYPARLEHPVYQAEAAVRRVRSNGQIKWRGELVFVSEALVGEDVGITEQEERWLVCFGPIPLGHLHPHQPSIQHLSSTLHAQRPKKSVTHVFG